MKLIYLVCHSGFLNYGDELIASTWLKFLSNRFADETIYVDTCRPGVSALLHRTPDNIIFTDTLWQIASSCLGQGLDYVLNMDFMRGISPAIELGLEHLRRARIVHLAGGGHMTDYHYPNYAIPLLLTTLRKECGFKLHATGLGIEPLREENRPIMQAMLNDFDWVDLRDRESYATVQAENGRSNVTLSPDDAFLAMFEADASETIEPKLVIIAQRDEIRDPVLPFLIRLVRTCPFSANGVTIAVLDKAADRALADQVRRLSPFDIDIVDQVDLWKRGLPATRGDFVFSTRFHGHLVASALGCRGLCASVRLPYYDIKHRSLIELGSGFDLIGMHDFDFGLYDWYKRTPTFADCREELRARKMQVIDQLYA